MNPEVAATTPQESGAQGLFCPLGTGTALERGGDMVPSEGSTRPVRSRMHGQE